MKGEVRKVSSGIVGIAFIMCASWQVWFWRPLTKAGTTTLVALRFLTGVYMPQLCKIQSRSLTGVQIKAHFEDGCGSTSC